MEASEELLRTEPPAGQPPDGRGGQKAIFDLNRPRREISPFDYRGGRTCFDAYGKYHLTGTGPTCLLIASNKTCFSSAYRPDLLHPYSRGGLLYGT